MIRDSNGWSRTIASEKQSVNKQGLHYKLTRVFALQALLIGAAVVLGIFISAKIFEHVLVKEALEGEALHFWERYAADPTAARPDTLNLLGYLAVERDYSAVPADLKDMQPGYGRAELNGKEPLVYVEDRGNARLYLVFDEEQVSGLAFYFGIVPLSVALIVIYLLSWFSYRMSKRAVSPIVHLAQKVDTFDFKNQRLGDLDLAEFRGSADSEVTMLVDALDRFTERVEDFVEREKEFTRDASHELRTPLAVVKSSLALLEKREDWQANEKRALVLIKRTLADMESLIETLLLLAREESVSMQVDDILVNDLITDVSHQVEQAFRNERIGLTIEEKCLLSVTAPEKVLTILFSNLLRNAFSYTAQGEIVVTIDDALVSIRDTGVGMGEGELSNVYKPFFRAQSGTQGHGLGLSIVKRFCNRYGWAVKISSKPGLGTEVTVLFPDARRVGRKRTADEG